MWAPSRIQQRSKWTIGHIERDNGIVRFFPGSRVEHPAIGYGTVSRIDSDRISITFDSGGERHFVTKIALPLLTPGPPKPRPQAVATQPRQRQQSVNRRTVTCQRRLCGFSWQTWVERPIRCRKCKSKQWDVPESEFNCVWCNHRWMAQQDGKIPKTCPKCTTKFWNDPEHVMHRRGPRKKRVLIETQSDTVAA